MKFSAAFTALVAAASCIHSTGATSLRGAANRTLISCPDDDCVVQDVVSEYPFIVSLTIAAGGASSACTGSLVSEAGWIITAAHCVFDEESGEVPEDTQVTVSFAPESRHSDADAQTVTIPYDGIHMNPKYKQHGEGEMEYNDDICLLQFDPQGVDFSNLATVDLAAGGSSPADFAGEAAQVMGYGTTGNQDIDDAEDGDRVFRTTTLTIVPCTDEHKQTDVICTKAPEAGDVCPGDSGGPLLLPKIIDGKPKFMQVAIVSMGPECADRVADPAGAGGSDEDADQGDGTWNFLPYQSEWMCEVGGEGVGLCDQSAENGDDGSEDSTDNDGNDNSGDESEDSNDDESESENKDRRLGMFF